MGSRSIVLKFVADNKKIELEISADTYVRVLSEVCLRGISTSKNLRRIKLGVLTILREAYLFAQSQKKSLSEQVLIRYLVTCRVMRKKKVGL